MGYLRIYRSSFAKWDILSRLGKYIEKLSGRMNYVLRFFLTVGVKKVVAFF